MAKTVLALAVFVLITNFGMALFRSPVIAWLGDLFNVNERSRANGVINLMGGVGGVLAFVGGGIIYDAFGRPGPFVAGAVALTVAMIVVLLLVKERKEQKEDSDPNESVKGLIPNLKAVFANKDKSMIFMLLAILCWFTGFGAVETGLSSFAVFSLGMKASTASIVAAVANLPSWLSPSPPG
jgi:MFS family permease